jgi:hypothetical protein
MERLIDFMLENKIIELKKILEPILEQHKAYLALLFSKLQILQENLKGFLIWKILSPENTVWIFHHPALIDR